MDIRIVPRALVLALSLVGASALANEALVFQTDFGLKDGAVSAMKGVAFGVDRTLPLHDLTHEIPAYNIFDLSARFQASETFSFTVAISNLFDKQPHVVGNSIGSTSFNSGNVYPSTYDALGRRFNVGARIRF